ncbi:hypothetical protein GCM10018962_15820 [Dactylosporangium matsuzakiense]|uniref:Uncharacterized protein n=1 Tax=Dactylosporangium matsuzakiense TaxID=53360 RepID=A0A9W6NQA7_9ACTN|nr:hypothetical protein GCM10017581_070860 [Dactylosporangium matsuzakiense]
MLPAAADGVDGDPARVERRGSSACAERLFTALTEGSAAVVALNADARSRSVLRERCVGYVVEVIRVPPWRAELRDCTIRHRGPGGDMTNGIPTPLIIIRGMPPCWNGAPAASRFRPQWTGSVPTFV